MRSSNPNNVYTRGEGFLGGHGSLPSVLGFVFGFVFGVLGFPFSLHLFAETKTHQKITKFKNCSCHSSSSNAQAH